MTTSLLPLHFVSALGPNVDPVDPKVRYLKSAPDFDTALRLREEERLANTENGFVIVIYRLFYDSQLDKFYSSRQFNLDLKNGGNELYAGEPQGRSALAYELFITPEALLSPSPAQPEPALSTQVRAIFAHSNTHRPGGVSP